MTTATRKPASFMSIRGLVILDKHCMWSATEIHRRCAHLLPRPTWSSAAMLGGEERFWLSVFSPEAVVQDTVRKRILG